MPEATPTASSYAAPGGGYTQGNPEKRRELELLRGELQTERATFLTHWRQLGEVFLPRRPRFDIYDINKGDKRHNNIYDSTGPFAVRTLASGMMAGITSPARPWFRLTTQDPALAERGAVKEWLADVTQKMGAMFLRSNLYNNLPIAYADMGVFGTSAIYVEEDFDKVMRFCTQPIGSYCVSVNERGIVDVFQRDFQMTVRQLIGRFGYDYPGDKIHWERFSTHVRQYWEVGQREAWIPVVHIIRPNPMHDPQRASAKYKAYESVYYELGYGGYETHASPEAGVYLRESGYDHFPVLCPRWAVTGEDSYGTDCPGMTALGDGRALQVLQRRKGNAIDKMINPPLVGPTQLKNSRISHLPGDVSFASERDGEKGLRPIYELRFDMAPVLDDIQQHQARIRRAFFEDLFLMISSDERTQPPTAEEIVERRSEKMIAIGSVLEQLNQDVLDPLIDLGFAMMERQGLIPPPPSEIQGQELKVEYISIMSQAQKLVGLSGMERFAGFAFKLAADTQDPTILDKVDKDQLIDEYGEALGVSPKIIRSDEKVEEIRQTRAQERDMAQAQQAAETIKQGASAAKDLSQADMSGDNALTQLIDRANAGNPLQGG